MMVWKVKVWSEKRLESVWGGRAATAVFDLTLPRRQRKANSLNSQMEALSSPSDQTDADNNPHRLILRIKAQISWNNSNYSI